MNGCDIASTDAALLDSFVDFKALIFLLPFGDWGDNRSWKHVTHVFVFVTIKVDKVSIVTFIGLLQYLLIAIIFSSTD
jgi:hypothetical protein